MGKPRKRQKKRIGGSSKKKYCKFCATKVDVVDYKHTQLLLRFVNDRGKIAPRRVTGTCASHQRILSRAIKRARFIGLIPYVREHYR